MCRLLVTWIGVVSVLRCKAADTEPPYVRTVRSTDFERQSCLSGMHRASTSLDLAILRLVSSAAGRGGSVPQVPPRPAGGRSDGRHADLITAVPLSSNRRRQRGYNQASLLGAALSRRTGLPMLDEALARRRETGTQVGLGPDERRENVSGAFEARQSAVRDKAVIIVDDLYTTGATLGACASSLFEAGATRVYGLTVARAGHIDPGANRHGGQYHNESPDQRPPIRAYGSDA